MDIAELHGLFGRTLEPSEETRRGAEAALAQAAEQPQFLPAVLRIVLEPQVDDRVRVAAAVYLKNRVSTGWFAAGDDKRIPRLPAADRATFKAEILGAVARVPLHIRPYLVQTISVVVDDKFETKWPELVPQIQHMLSQEDAMTVYTGFSVFLILCRHYRWSSLTGFDDLLAANFPGLLRLSESLLEQSSQLAALILYDFVKIVKMATARFIPRVIKQRDVTQRLVRVLLTLVVRPLPEDVQRLEPTEREFHPWAKTKKWATFLLRFVQKEYLGRSAQLSRHAKDNEEFRKMYKAEITDEVTRVLLEQITHWANKQLWLPQAALHNILTYLELVVGTKSGWAILEPHIDGLVALVIFPLLCPSEDDIDLFEDDPIEFVHKTIDAFTDSPFTDVSATNLLSKLATKRSTAFNSTVQFVQHTVTQLKGDTLDVAVRKIGIIRIMQTLSPLIMADNNVRDHMESFMAQYILPDYESQHGILVTRACQMVSAFARIEFKNRDTLQKLYTATLKCLFNDEHIPLQVQAALTLESLSQHDDVHAALGQHLKEVMQKLLDLTKQIDLDSLLAVLDEFVGAYPDQVSPFAVEMVSQLRDNFLALARELSDVQNISPDDFESGTAAEDKTTTGLGILSSITSMQQSLEGQRELMLRVCEAITPIFEAVYRLGLLDFFTETFALHENTLYTLKEVSSVQWSILPVLVEALKENGFIDFGDALPVLENYVMYGSGYLAAHADALNVFVQIVAEVISGENLDNGGEDQDRQLALALGGRLLLTPELQGGPLGPHIETLVLPTLDRMVVDKDHFADTPRYAFNLVTLVLSAVVSNAPHTLALLQARNFGEPFFILWLQHRELFTHVSDLKLQILVALALLGLEDGDAAAFVHPLVPQMLETLVRSLGALPGAIARQAELSKVLSNDDFDDDLYATEGEAGWDDADDADDGGFGDELDASAAFSEAASHVPGAGAFVLGHGAGAPGGAASGSAGGSAVLAGSEAGSGKASGPVRAADVLGLTQFEHYGADDFDEDLYVDSPLADLDVYAALQRTLSAMSQARPEHYSGLLNLLDEGDKHVLEDAVGRAGTNATPHQ